MAAGHSSCEDIRPKCARDTHLYGKLCIALDGRHLCIIILFSGVCWPQNRICVEMDWRLLQNVTTALVAIGCDFSIACAILIIHFTCVIYFYYHRCHYYYERFIFTICMSLRPCARTLEKRALISPPWLNKSLEINELITYVSMCACVQKHMCEREWECECYAFWRAVYSSLPIIVKRSRERQKRATTDGEGLEKNADIIRNIISSNILD